jgi:putative SOS response-associated peptidase YedK
MCYYAKPPEDLTEAEKEFAARFGRPETFISGKFTNGYAHPQMPVILDSDHQEIIIAEWGLVPHFAQDKTINAKTLNARIETIETTAMYRDSAQKRCIVLLQAFYEWKWHNPTAKTSLKDKYEISLKGQNLFAVAGLYNVWHGEPTFTIVTTEANTLMTDIHNTKKRMPVVLHRQEEKLWLNHEPLANYMDRSEIDLQAINLDQLPVQGSLF